MIRPFRTSEIEDYAFFWTIKKGFYRKYAIQWSILYN
jgi:hypothetical protein